MEITIFGLGFRVEVVRGFGRRPLWEALPSQARQAGARPEACLKGFRARGFGLSPGR